MEDLELAGYLANYYAFRNEWSRYDDYNKRLHHMDLREAYIAGFKTALHLQTTDKEIIGTTERLSQEDMLGVVL